ncbi:MAG: glycosyltransferase, partial [Gemmataceae bacterium]|nr:glycosyltransferase [Gemmataceae bacterium]
MSRPTFSLIVPTRGRPAQLRRLLASVAATAARPAEVEVVLVVDDDDPSSHGVRNPDLVVRTISGPPGRTMGTLNAAGYAASTGDHVMLLNDDVVIRTRGWDRVALRQLRRFPDGVALVHVNDTLMRDYLCTFPLVPRRFCILAGGICPTGYASYRIDDHIEDTFNMLAVLGVRRSVYLPDVIFEHQNAVTHPTAGRVYESADPAALAADAARFDAFSEQRKALTLRLIELIDPAGSPDVATARRARLGAITDPFALRTPDRHDIVRAPLWRRSPAIGRAAAARLAGCYRRGGVVGLARAAG